MIEELYPVPHRHRRLQAPGFPPAHVIDGEIAGDGKKPGLKTRASVVGASVLKNPDPCFLYHVIDLVALSQQIDKVANQTILILLDQSVEQSNIAFAKTTRNLL